MPCVLSVGLDDEMGVFDELRQGPERLLVGCRQEHRDRALVRGPGLAGCVKNVRARDSTREVGATTT